MATKAEVRTKFKDLLNNTLCTDALADHFIELAAKRISRSIKIKTLEKTLTTVVDGSYLGYITKPSDYRSIIEIRVDTGTDEYRLLRESTDEAMTYKYDAGALPKVWFREEDKFYIYPTPREGDTVKLRYHMALAIPVSDASSDVYSTELEDLVIYTALIYAADHFVDDRKPAFEQTASELASEIDGEERADDMGGTDIRVTSPYQGGY